MYIVYYETVQLLLIFFQFHVLCHKLPHQTSAPFNKKEGGRLSDFGEFATELFSPFMYYCYGADCLFFYARYKIWERLKNGANFQNTVYRASFEGVQQMQQHRAYENKKDSSNFWYFSSKNFRKLEKSERSDVRDATYTSLASPL